MRSREIQDLKNKGEMKTRIVTEYPFKTLDVAVLNSKTHTTCKSDRDVLRQKSLRSSFVIALRCNSRPIQLTHSNGTGRSMAFSRVIKICNHHYNQCLSPQKETLYPSAVALPFLILPSPRQPPPYCLSL